jgi:hypothetical protein
MSMIFTHFDDRSHLCMHGGTLGRRLKNGNRMCLRCGAIVCPSDQKEAFTRPVGRATDRRPSPSRKT